MHFLPPYETFINEQECISGRSRSPTLTHSSLRSGGGENELRGETMREEEGVCERERD